WLIATLVALTSLRQASESSGVYLLHARWASARELVQGCRLGCSLGACEAAQFRPHLGPYSATCSWPNPHKWRRETPRRTWSIARRRIARRPVLYRTKGVPSDRFSAP